MELHIYIVCLFTLQVIQDVSAYPSKGHSYKSEHCIKMTPEKEQEINAIVARLTDFLNNITTEFEDYDIRLIKLDIESHSEDEIEEKDVKLELTVNDCVEEEEWNSLEKRYESKEIDVTTEIPVVREAVTEKYTKTDTVKVAEKCSCAPKNSEQNEGSKEANLNTDNNRAPVEVIWFFDAGGDENTNTYDGIGFFDNKNEVTDKNQIIDQRNQVVDQKNEVSTAVGTIQNKNPELMSLDLTDVGEDVWEILEKRKKSPLLVYVQRKSNQDEYIFL